MNPTDCPITFRKITYRDVMDPVSKVVRFIHWISSIHSHVLQTI